MEMFIEEEQTSVFLVTLGMDKDLINRVYREAQELGSFFQDPQEFFKGFIYYFFLVNHKDFNGVSLSMSWFEYYDGLVEVIEDIIKEIPDDEKQTVSNLYYEYLANYEYWLIKQEEIIVSLFQSSMMLFLEDVDAYCLRYGVEAELYVRKIQFNLTGIGVVIEVFPYGS